MKCPYCGQEHPDNTKFCPETGNKLEPQSWVCSNPDCDYREPLPISAKFCPQCGKPRIETREGMSQENEEASCIMLETGHNEYMLIDTECNLLFDNSYHCFYTYYHETREISNCLITNNSKAYLLLKTGKLLEIGDYEKYQSSLAISSDGNYILIGRNRTFRLYRKDCNAGLVFISQFRIKAEDVDTFSIVGEFISLIYEDRFASINIKTGELLRFPEFKYSMLLANRRDGPIYIVSNSCPLENIDDCRVVDMYGKAIQSFPKGVYFPISDTNFIRFYNDKFGLTSLYGNEIIPPNFESIKIQDNNHYILKLDDWDDRILVYNPDDKSYTTMSPDYKSKINCKGKMLPESSEILDELLKEYEFGPILGYSSVFIEKDYEKVLRRCDQKLIYTLDEYEHIIGASDELNRFGISDGEYLSIYDGDGNLLKEFHDSQGIADPRLYSNGIILYFNDERTDLYIINVDFDLTVIHDSMFNGIFEAISLNCIAVALRGKEHERWRLYNTKGESILPEEIFTLSWKKLSDQFVVLKTENTSNNNKEGALLNLCNNSITPIPIPYENAFIIR